MGTLLRGLKRTAKRNGPPGVLTTDGAMRSTVSYTHLDVYKRQVCCVTGGIAVVTGQAGTGKTTFTRAVCRAFEEEGFRMIGTSTSQVATDNLKTETGIEAHNATSLIHQLNSNTLTLTSKDVLVIDEGGMFGAKNYNAIATYAEKAGAKILAIGDANQLQPIEAGNPFKVLCNELSDSEQRLSEIRRQKTPELLAIANAFYDKKMCIRDRSCSFPSY